MAFKPIDPKRDEFRRYLERSGVIEALTKVFVRLVKERPENPMEYLQHNLGDSILEADNVAYLQSELNEARAEIQRLRDILKSVNPEALLDVKEGTTETVVQFAESQQVAEKEVEKEQETKVTTEDTTPPVDSRATQEPDGETAPKESLDSSDKEEANLPPQTNSVTNNE